MKTLLFILVLLLTSPSAFSHSGRTDGKGGHNDRINGGYHYHHGKGPHQHPGGKCELSTRYQAAVSPRMGNRSQEKEGNNWGELLLVGGLGLGIGYFYRRSK